MFLKVLLLSARALPEQNPHLIFLFIGALTIAKLVSDQLKLLLFCLMGL
jgi:hypothetical protein